MNEDELISEVRWLRRLVTALVAALIMIAVFHAAAQDNKRFDKVSCKCQYEQIAVVAYIESRDRHIKDLAGSLTITSDSMIYVRIAQISMQMNFKYQGCLRSGIVRVYQVENKSWRGTITIYEEFARVEIWEKERKGIYLARLIFKTDKRL